MLKLNCVAIHPKFGAGTITALWDDQIRMRFEDGITRLFVISLANLTV